MKKLNLSHCDFFPTRFLTISKLSPPSPSMWLSVKGDRLTVDNSLWEAFKPSFSTQIQHTLFLELNGL